MKVIFLLFFLCQGYSLFSQKPGELDSLLKLLPFDKNDTNKVRHLIFISEDYCLTDPGKSLEYAKKALETAKSIKWERGMGSSYFRISHAYNALGNFSSALEFKLMELQKWENLKYDDGICCALADIGVAYSNLGNNVKAMEYYLSSLKFAEKIGQKERIITNLCNIATIQYCQGDTFKALDYYNKSLELSRKYNSLSHEADNLSNIGGIYGDQGKYTQALKNYFLAINIYEKLDNKTNKTAMLSNIGGMYQLQSDSARKKGNFEVEKNKNKQAKEYYFKALSMAEELGNTFFMSNFLGNIGAICIVDKQFKEAEQYLNKALKYAQESNAIDEITGIYQRFVELYRNEGKFEKALLFYEKFQELKDSVGNLNIKNTINELQIKYETEKKESENRTLLQKNQVQDLLLKNHRYLIYGLIFLLILLLVFGILLVRQNKLKALAKAAQFEQKLLRTQMNPHFIFNALASIESFIYEHQPKEAGMYLSSFSRLIRLILENSSSDYITLEKEIETLKFYLSLEKLRLYDNLDYKIMVDESVIPEDVCLPPMLAQPFIENSIEHGFRGITQKGSIIINFSVNDNRLEVRINDNGIGILQSQEQKELHRSHKSMAIQTTKDRLKFLNKSKKQKMFFSIKDLSDENKENSGTEVFFTIPLNINRNN